MNPHEKPPFAKVDGKAVPTRWIAQRCVDAVGTLVETGAWMTRGDAIRAIREIADVWTVDLNVVLDPSDADRLERDRLRDLLDRVHGELHDALNATPMDAPDGTGSGFEHEMTRRLLQRSLKGRR